MTESTASQSSSRKPGPGRAVVVVGKDDGPIEYATWSGWQVGLASRLVTRYVRRFVQRGRYWSSLRFWSSFTAPYCTVIQSCDVHSCVLPGKA